MTIKQFRGEEFIKVLEPASAVLQRALMGPFILQLELVDTGGIYPGDLLQLEDGETYTFEVRSIERRKVTAEHISYRLRNYAVIDKYLNDPPTFDDKIDFADVTLDAIVEFLQPLLEDAGFSVVNNALTADRKDISFSGDNLLSAIQKICETFKVEFVPHDTYIEFVEQAGHDTGITVNGGVNTELIQKKIDKSWIVTRIYPSGSGENLPDGYYYETLKPTSFDVATKTHTGELYIDNPEAIEKYGIIERVVEFSDIKIQSRRGTVQGTGTSYLEEYAKEYPYIYDEALTDIDEQKAENATLFIVDGLKAAELRIMKVSASEKKIWYSKTLKDGSELSWTPSVGASYTLVGYITQKEVDEAVQKLREEAQKYLQEHSEPKVEYKINTMYWKNPPQLNPGDNLRLVDETQGIDTKVRLVSFTKDLITGVYRQITLSNTIEKIPYEILKEQLEQRKELKRIKTRLDNSVRTAREALERHNLLVRNNFYGSENEYVLVGSEHRNYVMRGVTITPDDGTAGKVSWTAGEFQVVTESNSYQIGAGSVQLASGVYWIYVQLKKGDYANTSGYNKLVFSTEKKDNTADLLYYPLGMAEFDGTRTKVATSYGFTLIDGNYIKTGTIDADKITTGILRGQSGTTQFNLDDDLITVGSGVVKIGKGVLPDGGDGIFLNGSNLVVEGYIKATYLQTTHMLIVQRNYTTYTSFSLTINAESSAKSLTLYVLEDGKWLHYRLLIGGSGCSCIGDSGTGPGDLIIEWTDADGNSHSLTVSDFGGGVAAIISIIENLAVIDAQALASTPISLTITYNCPTGEFIESGSIYIKSHGISAVIPSTSAIPASTS